MRSLGGLRLVPLLLLLFCGGCRDTATGEAPGREARGPGRTPASTSAASAGEPGGRPGGPGAGAGAAAPSVPLTESLRDSTAAATTSAASSGAAAAMRDLSRDEALGGHTLARHVGLSDDELRERLRRERISTASTWTDRETAERVVGEALRREESRVLAWAARDGRRPNLALDYRGDGRLLGRSLRRGRSRAVPCYAAVVVLRWHEDRRTWYVLTAYPEASS